MKQGHLLFIFILISCGCFLSLYCEQKYYDATMQEKQRMESALLEAIEDTGNKSKAALFETEARKKKIVEAAFSEAMYVFTEVLDTPKEKEFWRLYVPMLVWVEEDGAYFYYVQRNSTNEEKELFHMWTEKLCFSFPEGCSDGKKKSLMADALEEKASDIISKHNAIAAQYGISYRYSLPVFFQDTSQVPEFPMLFVVFQGWPINHSDMFFFNACIDAGVFLRQKEEKEPQYPKILELSANEEHPEVSIEKRDAFLGAIGIRSVQ